MDGSVAFALTIALSLEWKKKTRREWSNQWYIELLALVAPTVQKQGTLMCAAISPVDRLSLTLRYLESGNAFVTAISPQAIGEIVI